MKALSLAVLVVSCSIAAWAADVHQTRDLAWQKERVGALIASLLPEFTMADDLLEADSVEWIRQHQPTARFGYACGRFRDDAHLDCAALLRKKSEENRARRVVVFQDVLDDKPKVVEVFSLEDYPHPDVYLDNLPKGEVHDVAEFKSFRIPREGFHLFFHGKSSIAFYYTGKHWRHVYTSD